MYSQLLYAGIDFTTATGSNTKWLYFCGTDSDCPGGHKCMAGKGIKSAGGICGKLTWCVAQLSVAALRLQSCSSVSV